MIDDDTTSTYTGSSTSGMSAGMSRRSISAFFDHRQDAEEAMSQLRSIGIPDSSIRLTEGAGSSPSSTGEEKGFFEALGDFFFPDDDREVYAEGLNRGGHLVTVTALDDTLYDAAFDILDDEGAVDLDERAESWRSEGWSSGRSAGSISGGAMGAGGMAAGTGFGEASAGGLAGSAYGSDSASGSYSESDSLGGSGSYGTSGSPTSGMMDDDETVEVVEERLRVGKRDTSHGSVRVRSYVVEEPVSESVTLRDERVELERRPVDRSVTPGDDAFRDKSIEAEEYREEAVVAKEARVVEEIGLKRTASEHQETVSDTLRHTEVDIEDDRDDDTTTPGIIRR